MMELTTQFTSLGGDYASSWNEYSRRRQGFYGIWLGGFAVMAVLVLLFDNESLRGWVIGVLGPIWMLTSIIISIRLSRFKCPRCARPFFQTWWYRNDFARRCVHCGLRKWAKTNSSGQDA